MDASSNHLPIQLTSFIGRAKEIAAITRLLDLPGLEDLEGLPRPRLLTLTGAGGCGKTRLAIQVARDLCGDDPPGRRFLDGVWFVDLAPLANPDLVLQTIATVFGLQEQAGRALADLLRDFLRAKNLLLVLDNCEHLIDACAQFADDVLRNASQVSILATSREALNIAGEITFRAPSLALPDPKNLPPLETLALCDAVQLFIVRATVAQSSFALTEQNARVVAQICHRLDGMPLALELAAARVKSMGIDEIAARLDDRFRLLTSAGRKVVPRQQTLRATMDWSYDLLSEQERVLLRRLSVFAGGWTLSAAEAICANSYLDSHAILDVQSQLIDKSLVVMDEPSGHARYHFLETVRQYAREKLVEAGEEELVCLHHLDYFLKLAEEAEPNLRATDQVDWMNRLELERDNLRTALSLTITYEHYLELGLRMAGSLWEFWSVRGYGREGNTWLQDLITRNETSQTSNMAKALYGAGALARDDGNNKIARMYFEKSLIIYRELNDRRGIAHVLGNLGLLNLRQGAYLTAKKRYGESLALFRELADQRGIADSLAGFGAIARSEGELMLARTFSEQALNIRRAIVDKAGMTFSLSALGGIASLLGDYPTATVYYEEALTIRHELGDMSIASYVPLLSLGYLALANNNLAVAQDYFSKSLALARRQTNEWRTMTSLSRLGYLALLKGNHDVAQSLFQKTLELARALGSKRYVSLALQYIGFLSAGRGDLQNATTCLADSLTVLWEDENQEFTAEFVVSCCETALVLSRAECVAQLLGVLEMLLKSTPMPHDPLYRIRHDRVVTTVRTQLDEATFNAAWAEGQAMTLEQAIAEALQVSAQHPVAQESKTSAEPRQYPGGLTRREVEVLRLLAVGLSNQEIADKLVLSKRTVHAHLRSIFAKLDVTTRTAATRVALEHKIV